MKKVQSCSAMQQGTCWQPINIYMDDTLIQSAIVKTIFPNGEAYIDGMSGVEEAKALG
jgi:hypothetical protein